MIIFVLILSIIGSALFAGLETGFVSLNRIRLRVKAGRGDRDAKYLLKIMDRPERVLSSFLIGNTLCNVGGGALATAWASQYLGATLGPITATLGMTSIFLVFSEVVPKIYFRERADVMLPRFTWFIRLSAFLFKPLVHVVSRMFKVLGGEGGRSPFLTREELRQLVREAGGRLGARQKRMLDSVFDFGHTHVREVMIPLPEVVSLPEDATLAEFTEIARTRGFTRIPVYRDRVDHIVGLVNVFDLLYASEPLTTIKDSIRPVHIVPETKTLPPIMVELQSRHEAMALVVNEFGAILGVVTLKDIVEEIMGELADEQEEVGRPLQQVSDGYILEASMDIDDLNEELELNIDKRGFETVAGLVLKEVGRIPKVGEVITIEDLSFEVLQVHQYGLRRLKLRQASKEGTEHDGHSHYVE